MLFFSYGNNVIVENRAGRNLERSFSQFILVHQGRINWQCILGCYLYNLTLNAFTNRDPTVYSVPVLKTDLNVRIFFFFFN